MEKRTHESEREKGRTIGRLEGRKEGKEEMELCYNFRNKAY